MKYSAGKQYQNAKMWVMTNSKTINKHQAFKKVNDPEQQKELTMLHWGPTLKELQGLAFKLLAANLNS